jgi:hypothetical protein
MITIIIYHALNKAELSTFKTDCDQNVYIFGLLCIKTMVFEPLIGQIGPAYDPLFYDVMVYIFGTMLFAVFLLGVIAFWLRRKGLGGGSAKERWAQELERYFEREQIGLIPDEKHHW